MVSCGVCWSAKIKRRRSLLKPEINLFSLAAALAAATLARYSPDAGWSMLAVGLLLTVALFAFDRGELRLVWQSIAFSGVASYCLVIAGLGGVLLSHMFWPQSLPWPLPFFWQLLAWLVLTAVLLAVDRARVDSRTPRGLFAARPQERASPPSSSVPKPKPAAALPKAVELPAHVGKPATIYLNLIDAGINCLRPVQAQHLGRDFYRIAEPMPTDEKWEFATGQIVRCQRRTLSSGKALVAVEEAPRADQS